MSSSAVQVKPSVADMSDNTRSQGHFIRRLVAKALRAIRIMLITFNIIVGGFGVWLILWPIAEITSGSGESFQTIMQAWTTSVPKGLGLVALGLVSFGLIRGIDWLLENTLAPPE